MMDKGLSIPKEDGIPDFVLGVDPEAGEYEDVFAELLREGLDDRDDETTSGGRLDRFEEDGPLNDHNLSYLDIDDGLSLYMKEVGRTPLLTQEEEIELARQIEWGRLAREELASGKAGAIRREELRTWIEAGWRAHRHLAMANSRLVISVAKKYANRGLMLLDLIQEGNIGLMRAIAKFDYRRGSRFSTYATWWIRQAVGRALADQARTIRIPVHLHDQMIRLGRARHELTQRLEHDPTLEELSEALGDSSERIENLIRATNLPLSLETPTDREGDLVLGDFVEEEKSLTPDDLADLHLLKENLEEAFLSLSPREALVLKLRYGLLDGKAYTLKEIGVRLGVTRERVRQIEVQAMERLRRTAACKDLQAYLIAR
jgi:RNA polymerase primary sigma factor